MIRSTFAGFTTAQLAMAASQRALDVTGQNIANINTEGYTRQRLDISSLNTQKGDFYNSNSTIKVGFGVEMTGVSQLRDPFLDAQYRSQISKLGTTDAHVAGFEQLATIFDESTMEGVRAAFISLSTSLNTLSKEAGNKEHDTAVRSNMQVLLNLFRENSVRLQDIRDDMQLGFESTDIADLNGILKNIAQLNTSIKNSQILGNPALELQDQRNLLLDELGSYLPITAKYTDHTIGPNQTVEILNVNFTDTEGQVHTLVSDGRYGHFDTDVYGQPVSLTLTDANAIRKQLAGNVKNYDGKFGFDSADIDPLNDLLKSISELNGQIQADPTDSDLQTQLDAKLKELKNYSPITAEYKDVTVGTGAASSTVKILDVNLTDIDGTAYSLVSNTDFVSFKADNNRSVTLVDSNNNETQLTGKLYDGAEDYVELLGSGTIKGTLDFLNKSGDFDGSDFKGLGYYEKALDSLVKTFAEEFNYANREVKRDADGKPIQATDPVTKAPLFKVDADGRPTDEPLYEFEDRPLFEKIDDTKDFSASNIKVAEGWLNGTYGITITNKVINDETGSTADENILNMVKLLDKSIDFTVGGVKFYSGSFHDCFANIENTLGIDAKSSNTLLENQISVLNQTSNSRDGISGVQLDEEGMSLLHYNQSYNAAARLMTTLDEALDKLINGTGVVGR